MYCTISPYRSYLPGSTVYDNYLKHVQVNLLINNYAYQFNINIYYELMVLLNINNHNINTNIYT